MKAVPLDKKKKLIIGGALLVLIVLVAWLLLGGRQTQTSPKMMSAKQAIAKAKAEIAARKGDPQVPARAVAQGSPDSAPAHVVAAAASVAQASSAPTHSTDVTDAPHGAAADHDSVIVSADPIKTAKAGPVKVPTAHAGKSSASVVKREHAASASRDTRVLNDSDYYRRVSRLSERLRILKLQAEIDKLDGKKSKSASGESEKASPVTVLPAAMTPAPNTDGKASGLTFSLPGAVSNRSGTRLVSVMGIAGHYQAVLNVNGASLAVHEGSRLSDGWTVTSISSSAVGLSRGKHHKTLRMGD